MKSADLTITVPAEIVALPNLSLAERVALAHLHEWPGSSNARLAKRLGLSERGVEQMLRRLRQRGLIQQLGKGRARTHTLLFRVEHHTECGQNDSTEFRAESHNECGECEKSEAMVSQLPADLRPELSVVDFVTREHAFAENCIRYGEVENALNHYLRSRRRIDLEPDLPQGARDKLLAIIGAEETRTLAFGLGIRIAQEKKLSHSNKARLYGYIGNLSREKLAEIRPRLEQAHLGNALDILALPGP